MADAEEFEDRIRRFERDWLAGRAGALDDYLAGAGADRRQLLVELAHIDLECRIKSGNPARAADYLARYPDLADDPAAAADLIAAEYEFRRRVEPDLAFDAVSAEYPRYRDSLRRHQSRFGKAPTGPSTLPIWPTVPGYVVLGRLGRGGMGVVYKARDERLGRAVALKFLPTEYARDPDRLALFRREARTASALNHPNVCTIHELGERDGRPFIVMEFVDGHTLAELIGQRVGQGDLARLFAQAARALAVAHAAGVVHRDVKPENLMARPDGYVKVVDFGLARRLPWSTLQAGGSSREVGQDGAAIGTIPYMSPEQARGQPPGPASDVFSLGVVLYEVLTGRHPFPAETPFGRLKVIVEHVPPRPSKVAPGVSAAMDELVGRMLEKDAARRPTAAEVDDTLTALASAPPRPPDAPPPDRPRRWTVGRIAERAELLSAFNAVSVGEGRMVCVVGEPGIGKTTLVEEFLADLAAGGRACFSARGRCSERLAEAEAYLPVLEALDGLLRGPAGDVAARWLRAVAPTWHAELTPDAPGRPADDAPGSSQPRMKRELVAFLQELSRQAPVVLVVDDAHWSDLPTADLLAYLGRHGPGLRVLLVVAYRRDELLLADHPLVGVVRDLQGRGVCREVAPELFDRADVEHYLGLAFPGHDFPPDLAAAVHAKTGGNPLFVADLTRYLSDRGAIARRPDGWGLVRPAGDVVGELPESVRGLIRRKLDRLPPADRRLLAAAAAQGAEFDSAVLAVALGDDPAEVEERLQTLDEVHGLVRLVREHEFPDRTVSRRYGFVHALYQEALAAALTPARRAALSRSLADALLDLHGGQPGPAAAELALLAEAGRDFGRAADLFLAAAQNAARLYAHREAAALARRGLGLLDRLSDTPQRSARELRLRTALGLQLQVTDGYAAPEAYGAYRRARELWDRVPDAAPLFPILWGLWLIYKVRSDLDRAGRMAAELLTLAEGSGDPALVLQARQAGAVVALCAGDPAATRAHMTAAVRLYDPGRHRVLTFQFGQDPGVACLAFGAVAEWLLGEVDGALDRSRAAVRLARDGSQPSTLALALHFAAVLHQFRGDPAGVRECAGEALDVSVEHRFAFWQAGATVLLGWATAADGLADGVGLIETGLTAWQATGSETYRAYYLGLLADARGRCGRADTALAALDESERVAVTTRERLFEPEVHRLRGDLLAGRSPREAEAAYRRAVAAARSQGARSLEARAAAGLARLLNGGK